MTNSPRILIVEDEPTLAAIFKDYLLAEGYSAEIKNTGEGVVEYVKIDPPSLILLDRMLPVKDGLTICKEIREFSIVPIILITAKVEELDRIQGLDCGADDYICKPASPKEVVSRVKALMRRSLVNEALLEKGKAISSFAEIENVNESGVRSLDLSEEESRMLEILSSAPQSTANAAQLQQAFASTHNLDQIIAKAEALNHKLAIVWQVDHPVRYNNDGSFSLRF